MYKIVTIEGIKTWIDQLNCLIPQQMVTHLQVACELLMGAINGTVHVVRDNFQAIKIPKKKENYFTRLKELHDDCKKNYLEVIERISK